MRVYDLAKELGKDSSKEILDILEKHNINLKSSSNISDEQAEIVKKEVGGHGRGTSETRSAAPDGEDAPKKKIAAVFRPQNAQLKPQGQRPQGQNSRDGRPSQGAPSRENAGRNQHVTEQSLQGETDPSREQRQETADSGASENGVSQSSQGGHSVSREARPQGQGGYQGNRDGRPQ
ncbi:MAG: translation initiation factor IF-2 N-terminal domain-containing protein, partial [Lacrimispora sp.]